MEFSTLFIDLDDTVYSCSCGLWPVIRERIGLYMVERLNIPAKEVPDLRRDLFQTYGTTLRGLETLYQVDVLDYLAFVHDVPIEDFLHPDPSLKRMLDSYPQSKWIFTNADRLHTTRVLNALGVEDCFKGVTDIQDISPWCKPMKDAFQIALARAGGPDPRSCVLVDDTPRNLDAARELGFTCVLVGDPACGDGFYGVVEKLADLPSVIPLPRQSARI